MLDIEKIQRLVEMMVANDLVEISLRDGEVEVKLRRPNSSPSEKDVVVSVQPSAPAIEGVASDLVRNATPIESTEEAEQELVEIKSPMVGKFYGAPDPEAAPFVHAGSLVAVGTVVCILEAMKVFSEIKAEVAGTIERLLVKNADVVEFGQPLFLVRPSSETP